MKKKDESEKDKENINSIAIQFKKDMLIPTFVLTRNLHLSDEELGACTKVIADALNNGVTPWVIRKLFKHPTIRVYLLEELLYHMLNN